MKKQKQKNLNIKKQKNAQIFLRIFLLNFLKEVL